MTGEIASVPVRLKNPGPGKLDVDCVRVFCDYHKGQGVTLSAYPGNGDMIEATSGLYKTVLQMKRLHRGTVAEQQKINRHQIESRSGDAWTLVQTLMEKRGLVLNTN
jgi:hypothetical protein